MSATRGEQQEAKVHQVVISLCDLCLDGKGGECHTPGCALWINRAPDLPIRDAAEVICPGCNRTVSMNTCGCGNRRGDCSPMEDGHSFVPMGCVCHYPRPKGLAAAVTLDEIAKHHGDALKAVNGDSNDAEHDALVAVVQWLEEVARDKRRRVKPDEPAKGGRT